MTKRASVRRGALRPATSKKRLAQSRGGPSPYPGRDSLATTLLTGGMFAVDRVADSFGMSKGQLAETVGLKREALYKKSRARARKTQTRLGEMVEIVSRISEWAGGRECAMAWYRSQPIPAFGGRTAEALVKTGKAAALRDYLDHLAMGGFA